MQHLAIALAMREFMLELPEYEYETEVTETIWPVMWRMLENEAGLAVEDDCPDITADEDFRSLYRIPPLPQKIGFTYSKLLNIRNSQLNLMPDIELRKGGANQSERANAFQTALNQGMLRETATLDIKDATDELVDKLICSESTPKLKHLSIIFDQDDEARIRRSLVSLTKSPIGGQLESLELQLPEDVNLGIRDFINTEKIFPRLKKLTLSAMTAEDIESLERFAPANFNSLSLTVDNADPILANLAKTPRILSQLQSLFLYNYYYDEPDTSHSINASFRKIFQSDHLKQLQYLHIISPAASIGAESLAAIREGNLPQTLRRLNLRGHPFGDEGLKLLSGIPFAQLENLDVSHSKITTEGIEQFFTNSSMPRLRVLRTTSNPIGNAGLHAIVRSDNMRNIKVLSVCRCDLTEDGIQELAAGENVSNLRELSIDCTPPIKEIETFPPDEQNMPGDKGVTAISRSPYLSNLRILFLGGMTIGAQAFRRLTESRTLESLGILHVGECNLEDDAFEVAANADGLPLLRFLNIARNNISAKAIEYLAAAPWSQRLWSLEISYNRSLGDGCIRAIAGEGRFPELRHLDAVACGLTENAIEYVRGNENFQRLAALRIGREEIAKLLERTLPLGGKTAHHMPF